MLLIVPKQRVNRRKVQLINLVGSAIVGQNEASTQPASECYDSLLTVSTEVMEHQLDTVAQDKFRIYILHKRRRYWIN